jgi:hypothetical protein
LIRSLLLKEIAARKRVLVGFDFAYGYPVDFAAALQAATGRSDQELPWLTVWRYFSETIKDDEATTPGGKPSNRSNRFEIANQITSLFHPIPRAQGRFGVHHQKQPSGTSRKSVRLNHFKLRRATSLKLCA